MDFRKLVSNPSPSLSERLLRVGLRGLSGPYWVGVTLKNWSYDHGWRQSYQSQLPTISVGNLSVGGTGKSPVVAWLAQRLRENGLRVAILSRGYGKLDDGRNDEALELEQLLPDVPHLQHWDRSASAKIAKDELDMQCLVLDDAFQHRRIARNLDIVLLDCTDTQSARRLLPAGLYRESISSLRRADIVILTRTDQARPETVLQLRHAVNDATPSALIIEANHRPRDLQIYPNRIVPLAKLQGQPVLAFCGIGNPNSFFTSLEKLGAEILDRRVWPDHHSYSRQNVDWLQKWSASHSTAKWIVCTKKDSVKIQAPALAGTPLAALRIELGMTADDEECLLSIVADVVSGVALEPRRESGRDTSTRAEI